MLGLEFLTQLTHHLVIEVTDIISDNLARNTIMIHYLFLNKSGNHLSCDISIGNNFNPLGEVINNN